MTRDQQTQNRILEAASEVFLHRGTTGARMQEVADEAGVNKALLHYYFGSKEQLAEAVFHRAAQQLVPPVIEALQSEAPLREKVRRAVSIYLSVLPHAPELPPYMLSEMHFHPERMERLVAMLTGGDARTLSDRVFGVLGPQIDEAVALGTLRPISPRQLVVNIISLCVFPFAARPLLTMLLGGEDKNFDAFIEERADVLADFILGAIEP